MDLELAEGGRSALYSNAQCFVRRRPDHAGRIEGTVLAEENILRRAIDHEAQEQFLATRDIHLAQS